MCGYPQFSFWIPIALDLLFPHSHKPHKNTLVLVGAVLNRKILVSEIVFYFLCLKGGGGGGWFVGGWLIFHRNL